MAAPRSNRIIAAEKVLKALANRRRLAIVLYLHSKDSASVGDVAEYIQLSFAATSRHLRALAAANLVENEQINTTVNYSLPKNKHLTLEVVLKIL